MTYEQYTYEDVLSDEPTSSTHATTEDPDLDAPFLFPLDDDSVFVFNDDAEAEPEAALSDNSGSEASADPAPPVEPDEPPLLIDVNWSELKAAIDEINVWEWEKNYQPDGVIMDGTSWSLNIQWDGRSVKSGGNNAYPERFKDFLGAVRVQLGGRDLY